MIITFICLACLAIGFIGGALIMSTTKPLVVEPSTPTIRAMPLVPAVTRKRHADKWVN